MTETSTPVTPTPEPVNYAAEVEVNKDARTWGLIAHLSFFAGAIIPFGSVVGPLIVWQIKKKEYAFVDDQGKEALNFQITVLLALIVSIVLMFVLIGFLLLPAVGICAIVFSIIGALKANQGIRYRYPFALRLIK